MARLLQQREGERETETKRKTERERVEKSKVERVLREREMDRSCVLHGPYNVQVKGYLIRQNVNGMAGLHNRHI